MIAPFATLRWPKHAHFEDDQFRQALSAAKSTKNLACGSIVHAGPPAPSMLPRSRQIPSSRRNVLRPSGVSVIFRTCLAISARQPRLSPQHRLTSRPTWSRERRPAVTTEFVLAASAMRLAVRASSQCAGPIGRKSLTSCHPKPAIRLARISGGDVQSRCPRPTTVG
jgi:hypothetical protein